MTTTSITTASSAPISRAETGRLFGLTMGLVALTGGLFALGAYIGRDTSAGCDLLVPRRLRSTLTVFAAVTPLVNVGLGLGLRPHGD